MLLNDPQALKEWKRRLLGGLSRREFLRAASVGAAAVCGAGGLLGPRRLLAAEQAPGRVKTGTFYFPRLVFHVKDNTGDHWGAGPVGDVILRKRLSELTNVNASTDPVVVRLADMDHLCRYPFVFATSEGYFDLPDGEKKNLKEFLQRGGFIHGDDCVLDTHGDRFFRDFVRIIDELFPENPMREVPFDHEIYHCYFDFDGPPQIREAKNRGFGLFEKDTGRIMAYASSGDLHCGWTCRYFPKDRNEAAIRMGVNIIIYYLTH